MNSDTISIKILEKVMRKYKNLSDLILSPAKCHARSAYHTLIPELKHTSLDSLFNGRTVVKVSIDGVDYYIDKGRDVKLFASESDAIVSVKLSNYSMYELDTIVKNYYKKTIEKLEKLRDNALIAKPEQRREALRRFEESFESIYENIESRAFALCESYINGKITSKNNC